jgi:hypothetical protein
MATYTDNFNRADGGLNSGDWGTWGGGGNLDISGNAVGAGGGNNLGGIYTAGTFTDDQYSQVQLVSGAVGKYGVMVRGSTSAAQGYLFQTDTYDSIGASIAIALLEVTAGPTYTIIDSDTIALAAGDVMYIEAVGTTITAKVNGSTVMTGTNATTSSGKAGIWGKFGTPNPSIDNWEGGDVGAPPADGPSIGSMYRVMRW